MDVGGMDLGEFDELSAGRVAAINRPVGVGGAVVLGVRWSRLDFVPPPLIDAPSIGDVARRFGWHCSLLMMGGIGVGITVIGVGGRLAMRLLAVTGGDNAQGRITEADQAVGEITVDGTIGLVLFTGVFVGVISAAAYLVLRRLLPPRWMGGLVFGAGLLVVLGTTSDPLRRDNPDFDIVGPGWLAVVTFTALALVFGVVLAACMARLSMWLPLPAGDRSTILRYIPVAVLGVVGFSITTALVVLGGAVVVATRWPPFVRFVRSSPPLWIGRVALVAFVAMSIPGAASSLADIAGRGP